ncbi:MAG: hypothetical protein ACTSUF_10250 [Candidatus Heimdallarchaeaceae archaeon]
MNEEIYYELDRLLHIIARVTADIDKEKEHYNRVIENNIKTLLLARQEVLRIVELVDKEKTNG